MSKKMYVKVHEIGDYICRIPLSGGKAGRGHAKTSNVQVVNTYSKMIICLFRFKINELDSKLKAIEDAKRCANTAYEKNNLDNQ